MKASSGFGSSQDGGNPGLLKELASAVSNVLHNMLSSGFSLNKLHAGGKGGKQRFIVLKHMFPLREQKGKQCLSGTSQKTLKLLLGRKVVQVAGHDKAAEFREFSNSHKR